MEIRKTILASDHLLHRFTWHTSSASRPLSRLRHYTRILCIDHGGVAPYTSNYLKPYQPILQGISTLRVVELVIRGRDEDDLLLSVGVRGTRSLKHVASSSGPAIFTLVSSTDNLGLERDGKSATTKLFCSPSMPNADARTCQLRE